MTDTVIAPSATVAYSQLAGSNIPREVDVSSVAVAAWQANVSIAGSALVRPTTPNQTGFWYQNSSSTGQSGDLEPAWPKTTGSTVIDGSLTLTAVVPPVGGADIIASVSWTQKSPPDGALTITNQTTGSLNATAYIGGGTSGQVYAIIVAVTMASGAIWAFQILMTIL